MKILNLKLSVAECIFIGILKLLIVGFFWIMVTENVPSDRVIGGVFEKTNDHGVNLKPIEFLAKTGEYKLSEDSGPYSGRMPSLIFPYVVFAFFFNSKTALLLLGLTQLAFSLFSTILLFDLLKRFVSDKVSMSIFIGFIICFMISAPFHDWDLKLNPESLANSVYITSMYFLFVGKNKYTILLAGLFFAWLFFLRGFLGVYVLSFLIVILFRGIKEQQKTGVLIKYLFIFMLPFIVFEGSWISRNYLSFNKFIPLQSSLLTNNDSSTTNKFYKSSMLHVRKLVASWGGETLNFYPNADILFFDTVTAKDYSVNFPAVIRNDEYLMDELFELKKEAAKSFVIYNIEQERKVTDLADQCYYSFKERHFLYWCCVSPIMRIKNFYSFNITSDWNGKSFKDASLLVKGIKLVNLGSYFLVLYFSLIFVALALVCRRLKSMFSLFLIFNLLLLLLVFATFLNTTDYKYFYTGYLSSYLLLVVLFSDRVKAFNFKKNNSVLNTMNSNNFTT